MPCASSPPLLLPPVSPSSPSPWLASFVASFHGFDYRGAVQQVAGAPPADGAAAAPALRPLGAGAGHPLVAAPSRSWRPFPRPHGPLHPPGSQQRALPGPPGSQQGCPLNPAGTKQDRPPSPTGMRPRRSPRPRAGPAGAAARRAVGRPGMGKGRGSLGRASTAAALATKGPSFQQVGMGAGDHGPDAEHRHRGPQVRLRGKAGEAATAQGRRRKIAGQARDDGKATRGGHRNGSPQAPGPWLRTGRPG